MRAFKPSTGKLTRHLSWSCRNLHARFPLDGRSLRASFGTTKYCNAFLRGLTCNNVDCLYLHELGQEEDSFTKEQIQSGQVSRVHPSMCFCYYFPSTDIIQVVYRSTVRQWSSSEGDGEWWAIRKRAEGSEPGAATSRLRSHAVTSSSSTKSIIAGVATQYLCTTATWNESGYVTTGRRCLSEPTVFFVRTKQLSATSSPIQSDTTIHEHSLWG